MGSTVFDDAIKYYGVKNSGYKGVRGRWEGNNPNYIDGVSDNFKSFKDAKSSNKTPAQSAFETWTGKQAIKQGFTKAKIIIDEKDLVIVEFTK